MNTKGLLDQYSYHLNPCEYSLSGVNEMDRLVVGDDVTAIALMTLCSGFC